MNVKRMLGLDTRADRYTYEVDPAAGYVSSQRVPERWVATTCGYCSVGCGIYVGVRNGKAVSVRGIPDHSVNRGLLCPKGLAEHHTIHTVNRAEFPQLRQADGTRARVTWDHALETMASRFRSIQERYGRESIGVISTGQLVTEEFYALGKLVQLGIGTRHYDGNTTLCMATAVSGYKKSFGSDGPPGAYEDLEHADVIILIGANIAENHPILCWRLQRNPNATVIVIDPRVTKTAMMADLHLPLRPRSDLALINGLIHILIEHDLIDRDYIARATTGFEALRESVRDYTPERVAEITGIPPETIWRVAFTYAKARAGFIGWTMGVNHSTKGTETVNAINNLALITGNIGRAGASPFSITGQCNAMGTREAGFASSLPGYRKFESEAGPSRPRGALEHSGRADTDRARLRVSRHHRSGAGEEDPRPVDHRDQPDRLVPEPEIAAAGARGARVPRRPGRLSPDADERVRRPDAAGGDVGREGRDLHQLRAARQPCQQGGQPAGRGAVRLRHLPRARRQAGRA